ncbi:hypothetical protein CYMTET_25394, partial [Cymbomonas tetramitiformis]
MSPAKPVGDRSKKPAEDKKPWNSVLGWEVLKRKQNLLMDGVRKLKSAATSHGEESISVKKWQDGKMKLSVYSPFNPPSPRKRRQSNFRQSLRRALPEDSSGKASQEGPPPRVSGLGTAVQEEEASSPTTPSATSSGNMESQSGIFEDVAFNMEGDGLTMAVTGMPSRFRIRIIKEDSLPQGDMLCLQDFDIYLKQAPGGYTPTFYIREVEPMELYEVDYTSSSPGRLCFHLLLHQEKIGLQYVVPIEIPFTTAAHCTVAGAGLTSAIAGSVSSLTLTSRDQLRNVRPVGSDERFTLSFKGPGRMGKAGITDKGDGTYYVYYIPTCTGHYKLFIMLTSDDNTDTPVQGSPFCFEVTPGPVMPLKTSMDGPTQVMCGAEAWFQLKPRDRYGNDIKKTPEGCFFYAQLMDKYLNTVQVPIIRSATDELWGHYSATVAGKYKMQIFHHVSGAFPSSTPPPTPSLPGSSSPFATIAFLEELVRRCTPEHPPCWDTPSTENADDNESQPVACMDAPCVMHIFPSTSHAEESFLINSKLMTERMQAGETRLIFVQACDQYGNK